MAEEPSIPAGIAFDGRDVTAGRLVAQADPLPLGYDPWDERPAWAGAAGAAGGCGGPSALPGGGKRDPACSDVPAPPDGAIGAWRLSRGWRSLAQVATARGSPWRLTPLPPPPPPTQRLAPGAPAAGGPGGGLTARGWKILAAGLLLALAMIGGGMALRLRNGGVTAAAARGGAAALEPARARAQMRVERR